MITCLFFSVLPVFFFFKLNNQDIHVGVTRGCSPSLDELLPLYHGTFMFIHCFLYTNVNLFVAFDMFSFLSGRIYP